MLVLSLTSVSAQENYPNTHKKGWKNLFGKNLENAQFNPSIWKDSSGILTASKDECIWSKEMYDNFILDLDFQTADGTNSGVIVHATETKEWIPHSVEIQIADDYSTTWSKAEPSWQCAAIFGHQPATHKNLKRLVAKKIFACKQNKEDARKKNIEKGSKFDEFIAYLEE